MCPIGPGDGLGDVPIGPGDGPITGHFDHPLGPGDGHHLDMPSPVPEYKGLELAGTCGDSPQKPKIAHAGPAQIVGDR